MSEHTPGVTTVTPDGPDDRDRPQVFYFEPGAREGVELEASGLNTNAWLWFHVWDRDQRRTRIAGCAYIDKADLKALGEAYTALADTLDDE